MSTVIIVLLVVDILLVLVLIASVKYFSNKHWLNMESIRYYKEQKEKWMKRALIYKKERDCHITRRVDLETALLWWVNERMKGFSDDQYGKGKLKELIEKNKLIDISKVSE